MISLALSFGRNGGGPRAALVAGCTAVVSGLLLVMLTLVLFTTSSGARHEPLSNLVLEGELRAGYTVALGLICLAPLTLLQQVLRLGTASREQRLAALRLAGATPGDVRRLGAWEVGVPALVGGLLGYLVFRVLRLLFGGAVGARVRADPTDDVARQLGLVPTTVHPAWWQVLLVAAAVGLLGALAGYLTSRPVEVSPLGVSRRSARPAPRPWLGLVLLVGVPVALIAFAPLGQWGIFPLAVSLFSLVLGLLALTPWVAHRVGRLVAARASSVPLLVAAGRLAADSRATGRAAATIGAISMVAAAVGVLLTTLPQSYEGDEGFSEVEAFYLVPMALIGVVLLVALSLAVFSMAVHGVESLVDRRRSVASLAALGLEIEDLARIQRWEVGLVAVPVAVIGVVVGSVPFLVLSGESVLAYAWIPLVVDAVTVGLVWAASLLSTRLTRPWLVRAASPLNLRTA